MSTYQDIATEIRGITAYTLANDAKSACDNDEATAFYEGIRDAYADAIEYAEGKPDEDTEHEIADGAPDIYNYTRMLELIGTKCYLDDASEYAAPGDDILTLAGYVLYSLAQTVVSNLATYYDEEASDDEDEAGE